MKMKKSISLLLTVCLLLGLCSVLGPVTNAASERAAVQYEYLQLDGVQKWTEAQLAQSSANNGHESNVTATYYLSDQWLVGEAAQSIKAVKSSASAQFNCLVNKAYGSNGIAAPSPWAPADGTSKVSEYDGVMIAVRDQNGNVPSISGVQLRVLQNPAANSWGTYQVSKTYTVTEDGYMKFAFSDFPSESGVRGDIDTAQGISFLLYSSGVTEYYFSDFKAYREKKVTDFSALEEAIDALTAFNADGTYDEVLAEARDVLNDKDAPQDVVDEAVADLRRILRPLQLPEVDFDEDNIVLSFGAVSDIHITGSTTSSDTKKYEKALQLLKKYAGGKLDAITIAGDISSSSYSSSIGTAFKTVTDQELGANANVFFVSGNHDAQSNEWSTLSALYNDLAKYTQNDLPSSQHERGNRHMVIGGYHYLAVNMMDYWNGSEAMFNNQDLEWLADELEAARADAPGQPIFVYVHAGVYGTTYGSDLYTGTYWGSKKIYSYLENYPEVVTFSGHVHFPLMDQRTIWQKDFTSLNCGSVQYMAIESGYLQSGSKTTIDNGGTISGGLLVQVDKNNNLKITRLNFAKDAVIKEPFYISAPDLENETNLLHYNEDYFHLENTAPAFSLGAMASGSINGSNLNLNFDAATDDDMVHHYLVDIKDLASGKVQSTKIFSEFYFYSNTEEMPKNYTFKVPYTGGKDFAITLYAVDSVGMKSEPITFDSTAPAKNGWVYEYGKWGFYVENIRMTDQWLPDDEGNWYYLDETGYRVTEAGLFFDGSDWYYLNEEGAQQYNVWYEGEDGTHFFGDDGIMVTNSWVDYEGERYFFNSAGDLQQDTWIPTKNKWYYVDDDGCMLTNAWMQTGNQTYYLTKDGSAAQDTWAEIDSRWYYFNEKCVMLTTCWKYKDGKLFYLSAEGAAYKNAWAKINDSWYYFGGDSGKVTNKWVKDSVGWCYLGADGRAVTNTWKQDSVGWCYLNGSGSMTKNAWVKDNGKWYFLDENGYMVTNAWKKDSKGWVYVGSDGAMLTNAWCKDSQGWCYVGADGYAVTNCWKKDSHGWIWLNASGSMTKNAWVHDGSGWYFLDANGYMVSNTWKKDSKGWCYLGSSGKMLTNAWCKDSKGWCYVGENGYAVTNCWKKDSHGWIWLDENGSMKKNAWVSDKGNWYYVDGEGYMVYSTSLTIGGTKYNFNASGVCTNP